MARPTSEQKKVKAGGGVVWRRRAGSASGVGGSACGGNPIGEVGSVSGGDPIGEVGSVSGGDPIGEVQVLLVHRRRYDDWSFPKGKLEPDEKYRHGAAREVLEETGLHVRLGAELAQTRYIDGCGRPKKVRYWAMTVLAGFFVPNDEVDQVAWVGIDEAAARLTYPHDAVVLDSFVSVLGTLVAPIGHPPPP